MVTTCCYADSIISHWLIIVADPKPRTFSSGEANKIVLHCPIEWRQLCVVDISRTQQEKINLIFLHIFPFYFFPHGFNAIVR